MTSDELCWLSATDLAALIRRRKVSPVEVVEGVLDRIERLNPQVNAYVTVTADQARRVARAAERALGRRRPAVGTLHGVPFAVKDLVITKGVRTTFGTPLFADHVPTEDAPMVARLLAAGAIMVGKTNTGYVQAWFDRLAWWQHPRALFERDDLLLTPTVACPPFGLGLDYPSEIAGKTVTSYGWIPYTYPFNLTGQPAASVPFGFTRDGLPIGLQIVGRRFDDASVLRAAAAFERERPWSNARPAL
jgi:Asp-tRNA(Asn)/Glu-tRNA(Gln) amidotransferase A subunit family amidase